MSESEYNLGWNDGLEAGAMRAALSAPRPEARDGLPKTPDESVSDRLADVLATLESTYGNHDYADNITDLLADAVRMNVIDIEGLVQSVRLAIAHAAAERT